MGTHRILEYKKHNKAFLVTSDSWYDTEGQLARGPNGYARVEYEYNARNKTRVAYISPDGSPFFYKKDGYATMVSEYNYDKILSTYYYGSDNELIAGKAGYAYVIYTYKNDYKTEMYYNADGTPYFNKNGVCGVRKKAGRRGRIVEEYYYVGEGVRGRSIDGYAKVKRTYDTYGKVIIDSYYDENDQPMMVELLGYARVKNIYLSNHLVRTEYYDTKQKPVRSATGIAVIKYQIENKMTVSEAYYDTDGVTLVNNPEGYARIDYAYDGKQMISEKLFTADDEPFYDGDLFNEVRYTWQDKKKASVSYWKDGTEANGHDGYHEVLFEYNNAG